MHTTIASNCSTDPMSNDPSICDPVLSHSPSSIHLFVPSNGSAAQLSKVIRATPRNATPFPCMRPAGFFPDPVAWGAGGLPMARHFQGSSTQSETQTKKRKTFHLLGCWTLSPS
jgi:hypothetical protein